MKRVILTFLISMTAFFGLVATGAGQDESTLQADKQRWDAMSKEERADIINAYRRWKSLDETKRGEIAKRYQQFRSLSDEEKVNVAVNLCRFRSMPPERQRILREHLHAGPEGRTSQLCFMRILSSAQEEAGDQQPVDKQVVFREFRGWLQRYLDEVIYASLTEDDRAIIDTMPEQWRVMALLEKMKEEIRKNPPADIGEQGSPGYEMEISREAMQRCLNWIAEQLPPGMPEIAFYIRTHAFAAFPRERMMEILQAQPDDVKSKVQDLAKTDEMAQIISGMPEDLRTEYANLDDQQKLKVIVMAFRPFAEAGPRPFRHHFEHCGPMPPPGDMQSHPDNMPPHSGDMDRDRDEDRSRGDDEQRRPERAPSSDGDGETRPVMHYYGPGGSF